MASSKSSSTSSTSSESLNGLKFGQKIYFEDVGLGVQAKSGGGSSSASRGLPPTPAKKGRAAGGGGSGGGGVVQGGQQPPRCQVEGCNIDLSDAKSYYSRHKVCGMHSKSPKVIVSGIEQRFCQQCSRFHLLPEFDQGKRSCRRRLAGHNERRRKPPAGSLLCTRYGSSSIFETSNEAGGYLLDFTTYPRLTGRDEWPPTRASEQVSSSQPPGYGKSLPHPWQSNTESPSLEIQGSADRTPYPGRGIPPGGCFTTGVSDSSCARSFLSNQPHDSRIRSSSLGANYLLHTDSSHIVQPAVTHAANISHFSSSSWGFKGNEAGAGSFDMHPELGLGQISQPGNSPYTGHLQLAQQSERQYMDLEHSRAFDPSPQHMNWSL